MIPVLQEMSWRPWLERISIFKAYNPVELVTTGESFEFNLSVLSGIGVSLIALAFVAFAYATCRPTAEESAYMTSTIASTTRLSGRESWDWPTRTTSPGGTPRDRFRANASRHRGIDSEFRYALADRSTVGSTSATRHTKPRVLARSAGVKRPVARADRLAPPGVPRRRGRSSGSSAKKWRPTAKP